jgi:hypothetical protein
MIKTVANGLFVVFAGLLLSVDAVAETKHALLVGCTEYKSLPEDKQLKGSENDVKLFRQVLLDRFDFEPQRDKISVLTASQDKDNQPTRANIEREFRRLAERVQPGERVVILLTGHGSQEPDDDPDNPADYEPDGWDETFLPCDIGEWNPRIGVVENSIRDDELREWIRNILAREAKVWMIVDACHSGSGVRGSDSENLRQVPPDMLIPKNVLEKVAKAVATKTDVSEHASENAESLFDSPGEFVAIYAAQPHERTPERLLPREVDSPLRKMHGLLTFTICDVINRMHGKVTYNELVEAVHTRYILMGKRSPTPFIEGNGRDRIVLGQTSFPSRSHFRLQKKFSFSPLRLDAGALDGLTKGSILAMSDPEIDADNSDEILGYLRIVGLGVIESTVEPCEYSGVAKPSRSSLRHLSRCQVVQRQLSDFRLLIGVDRTDADGQPVDAQLRQEIANALRTAEQPLVRFVDDIKQATWTVNMDGDSLRLVPSGGLATDPATGEPIEVAVIERTEGWQDRLSDACGRIARANSLLQISEIGTKSVERVKALGLQLKVLADGQSLPWTSSGRTLSDGQQLVVEMKNGSQNSLDVTVLYVDSSYGISCLYPRIGEYNRLAPGDANRIDEMTVNAETTGIENMVVIAARADGQPKDYRFLEQPTLSRDRKRGNASDPLEQLCETAIYNRGNRRSIAREHAMNYQVTVTTWRVVKKK